MIILLIIISTILLIFLGFSAFLGKLNWGTVLTFSLVLLLLMPVIIIFNLLIGLDLSNLENSFILVILLIIISTILLIFLGFSAFLGKLNWGTVLTFSLVLLLLMSVIIIFNLLIGLDLSNLENSFISIIITIISTPFLIALSNLYNKQRDINELINERKRDDYKYLHKSIKDYLDFIYEFQAKLKVIIIANLDSNDIKILIGYYEKLLKGILKYKLMSKDQLDKYLLKNFYFPNDNNFDLNIIDDIEELLEMISQKINTVLKDSEEEAQKQNYDNAIQKINKLINGIE